MCDKICAACECIQYSTCKCGLFLMLSLYYWKLCNVGYRYEVEVAVVVSEVVFVIVCFIVHVQYVILFLNKCNVSKYP